jgi:hypothetical protein
MGYSVCVTIFKSRGPFVSALAGAKGGHVWAKMQSLGLGSSEDCPKLHRRRFFSQIHVHVVIIYIM